VVLAVGRPGQQSQQSHYAESSLLSTLIRHGQTAAAGDPATTEHSLVHPQDTCKTTGAAFLLFPRLLTTSTDMAAGVDAWTDARLQLLVWNCAKQRYERPDPFVASAFSSRSAIDRATLKTVTTYLTKL
jgi:hypothetical protein